MIWKSKRHNNISKTGSIKLTKYVFLSFFIRYIMHLYSYCNIFALITLPTFINSVCAWSLLLQSFNGLHLWMEHIWRSCTRLRDVKSCGWNAGKAAYIAVCQAFVASKFDGFPRSHRVTVSEFTIMYRCIILNNEPGRMYVLVPDDWA